MIEKYETIEGVEALKATWVRLEQDAAMRVFQTFVWNCEALKMSSEMRPYVLKWTCEGSDDCVIFPFCIDRRGNLRFVADEFSDVCAVVSSHDGLNRHHAYKEMAETVSQDRRIKNIWLQKLDACGDSLRYLAGCFGDAVVFRDHLRGKIRSEKTNDFIAGQTHLRQKERSRLRSIAHRAGDLPFTVVDNRPEQSELRKLAWSGIALLREKMVTKGVRSGAWMSQSMMAFVQKVVMSGYAELACLGPLENPLAVGIRLVKSGQADSWICLADEARLVSTLYVLYMEAKCRDGEWAFDFGVGDYDYKRQTFRPEPQVSFTLRRSKGAWGTFWNFFRANVRLWRIARARS